MSNKIELQSNNTDLANLLTQLNELPNTTLLPHAERHAAGGEDPISPESIGAAPSSEVEALRARIQELESMPHSNPNLLDNWYFGNPVNQRGQTEYTGNGYTIDRWKTVSGGVVAKIDEKLVMDNSQSANTAYFGQNFEENLVGYLVTLSVLTTEGLYYSSGFVLDNNSWQLRSPIGESAELYFQKSTAGAQGVFFSIQAGAALDILAVKLELGDGQTLAHQDADGNWVLNEIPNYAEELAKCQRYQIVFGSETELIPLGAGNAISATEASITVPLPVSMRAKPTLTLANSNIALRNGSSTKSATNVRIDVCGPGCAYVRVTSSELTIGYACEAWLDRGSKLILDANL